MAATQSPVTPEDPVDRRTATAPDAVTFAKYTSFGNTFLIVDESTGGFRDDADRASFARWALNGDFGIGGTDNVLYLDREADGRVRFRIFEVDGSETLSCGNGLLSTALALYDAGSREESWSVLTEIPTGSPRPVPVGVDDDGTWVGVGQVRATPPQLYRRPGPAPEDGIDEVPDVLVALPPGGPGVVPDLPDKVLLRGLLAFTGEPHLVLFSGVGFPSELEDHVFVEPTRASGTGIGLPPVEAVSASDALVHHIGVTVNEQYRHLFPEGVHLNFARVTDAGAVEYRTWERAINRETLACGSGAVAMAHVARRAGTVSSGPVDFHPHRCRWYRPDAVLRVTPGEDGYGLHGRPRLVCRGTVAWPEAGAS